MTETFDKEKILESMFDPETSEILAELETSEKDIEYLSQKFSLSEDTIKEKLSYLIQHEFVFESNNENKTIFKANASKLGQIVESDKNFDGVVDGLTELDSYLN